MKRHLSTTSQSVVASTMKIDMTTRGAELFDKMHPVNETARFAYLGRHDNVAYSIDIQSATTNDKLCSAVIEGDDGTRTVHLASSSVVNDHQYAVGRLFGPEVAADFGSKLPDERLSSLADMVTAHKEAWDAAKDMRESVSYNYGKELKTPEHLRELALEQQRQDPHAPEYQGWELG